MKQFWRGMYFGFALVGFIWIAITLTSAVITLVAPSGEENYSTGELYQRIEDIRQVLTPEQNCAIYRAAEARGWLVKNNPCI